MVPRKLNIGCGYDYRDGWHNVDNADHHKVDALLDVTDLAELPGGYFEYILAQDVLEHIPRPMQVDTLQGWARLMAADSVLHITVPSFLDLDWQTRTNPDWRSAEMQHTAIQCGWGTQAYPGDFHHCSYTPVTLLDLAKTCGLRLARCRLKDSWLYEIDFKTAGTAPSDSDWLHEAYMRYLWRPADPTGFEHHLSLLANGTSRQSIVDVLVEAETAERWRTG